MGAPERVTDHDVTEALAALPDSTAAEIAGALGIGRSTAAKRLARLEGQGAVRRSPGGRVEGTKVADRWSLPTPPAACEPGVTATPGDVERCPQASSQPGDTEPVDTEPASDPSVRQEETPGAGTRLLPGSLRALVLDYLAARPGQSFGPSGIARSLGRSAGAVSNALAVLAESGEVRLVADRPRRYRISAR
jgi:DNA-binding MarR family transcriptional regulator